MFPRLEDKRAGNSTFFIDTIIFFFILEWAIQANKKIANLILKNIINLPGPALEISTGPKCFNCLHKFIGYVHSIILPIFQFIVRCITSWINRFLGYVGYEQLSDD